MANAKANMTEALKNAILEGQREKVVQDIIKRITVDTNYANFINTSIENVLSNILGQQVDNVVSNDKNPTLSRHSSLPLPKTHPIWSKLEKQISSTVQKINTPFEDRVGSLETLLFRTNKTKRLSFFDPVFQEMNKLDEKFKKETKHLEKLVLEAEKR